MIAQADRKRCRRQLPYLLGGAILTALTLIFPQVGILEWLTMVPLLIGVYRLCEDPACSLKQAYGYGFLTLYVFYFIIYHWIVYLYPLDFIEMDRFSSGVVTAVAWLGLPILQGLGGGFVFLFFRLLHKTALFQRAPLLRPFSFASLWVIYEWTSTLNWTGVPWGRLCLGQTELLPILQSASLFGCYFISWLLVLVNALIAYAILYRLRALACAGLATALFCSNLLYGAIVLALPEKDDGEKLTVAVVQGNVNSHDKWGDDSYTITTEIYGEYTRRAAAEGAELVIWPESTFPTYLNHSVGTQRYLSELAQECDVTLLVGALYFDADTGKNYNSLFLIEPDGEIREEFYSKRHLVPFGEYVPMRDLIMTLIPPLAELSALGDDVSPGEDPALFETEWGSIGSLICFDSIYEQLSIDSVREGAELLVLSSNDSWFFDSAAVYQHQVQAQLRAIETGRYLARSGNTGISSILTPRGETIEWIEPLIDGYAVNEVAMRSDRTLYSVIGNTWIYLSILLEGGLLIVGLILNKKSENII